MPLNYYFANCVVSVQRYIVSSPSNTVNIQDTVTKTWFFFSLGRIYHL